ncbi:MAG: N-acetylglutaminylglutamine synthetase [Betaproteobacteria bacterium HGW-Betaproteobacteria-7]|jgi:GNAT-family acetyltransferase (TIGR03103 family)|nr:MAG: N-acetylglutaminylglutamine synthetase [Betaproteobacteria bacterium HGW-Betaproteobacteria-7]
MKRQANRALRLGRGPIPCTPNSSGASFNPVLQEKHRQVALACGWGRLIAGHTFDDAQQIAQALLAEQPGQRDIAFYLDKPHVVVAQAPQQLFVDPSETYRLNFNNYRPAKATLRGFAIRRLRTRSDIAALNALYRARRMVPVDPQFVWSQRTARHLVYALAEDRVSGEVIGVAMGLDHGEAFGDPDQGCSLWALAVSPQAGHPGVGEALTRYLAERFQARGRGYMDISVLHDNLSAIALYKKLGFQNIQVFAVKRRNVINESLFTEPGSQADANLNIYARIIVDEARRRGIMVETIDAENGYFRLTYAGRSIVCRESLSELTSAVAMSRCADKRVTLRLLRDAGLKVPAQMKAGALEDNAAFLQCHGAVVVKPADGEQGKGVAVNLTTSDEVETAIEHASRFGEHVVLEQFCTGQDLRIVVINHKVVAAAVRRPASVVGDGLSSVEQLIEKQSRRRAAATGGESRIPMDGETRRCITAQGFDFASVLAPGETLVVRNTANLHTGGTIHDVTEMLHPALRLAAEQASRILNIPVTGLDFLVPSVDGEDYVIIEANERPGLANHEPQPTAERFIDLLFPRTGVEERAQ